MRKSFLFLLTCFVMRAHAQSADNYTITQMMQQPVTDWTCGARNFSVMADVCIYVQTDSWVMEIQGTEEQSTLTLANSKLQTRIDALTKKLTARGILSTDIVVTTVSQERVRENKQNDKGQWVNVVTGYALTKKMQIKYKEMSEYAGIISDASTQLFDQLISNYCTVADEQAVYAELYRQAMEVALDKQNQDVTYYGATIVPGGKVTQEKYDLLVPDPSATSQVGQQRTMITSFDRIVGADNGATAVRYFIHLEYSFALEKANAVKPKPKTK